MLSHTQARRLRQTPLGQAANRIGAAMALAKVTQNDIAAATGLPQGEISRMKNGGYSSRFPLERARTLATFFGVSIEDLFPARDTVGAR